MEDSPPLALYWMPGCSSCLRMKEFVESHHVRYRSVNVVEEPEALALLERLHLFVPAAVRGDRGAPGVDLVAVASLAGIDYTPPDKLPPLTLYRRYLGVMEVATALIGQLTPAALDYRDVDRPRSLRELALHVATIMRGFVAVEETNYFLQGYEFMPADLLGSGTASDIMGVCRDTTAQLESWWAEIGSTDTFDRVVDSKAGAWTLHEAFERAVWHTTQHVRQLEWFLAERIGLTPAERLTAEQLAGLPLPEAIHAAD